MIWARLVLAIPALLVLVSFSWAQSEKRYQCLKDCRDRHGDVIMPSLGTEALRCNTLASNDGSCEARMKAEQDRRGREEERNEQRKSCDAGCSSKFKNSFWEAWKPECDQEKVGRC